ncbi:hypothetical protein [Tomitella gaofuii]|uniref:hypothetical protein n=1 Tax=Tomitella gaofuii TaxID=2760083 RepID=UPI0020BDFB74|nr:hypothetical protein [Tomitella gaofuii]
MTILYAEVQQSELLRRSPDASVVRWLDEQSTATLSLTSITVAGTRYPVRISGVAGRRP